MDKRKRKKGNHLKRKMLNEAIVYVGIHVIQCYM